MKGDKYKGSGKVDWGKFIPLFLLGIVVSILAGMAYGKLVNINPFIYVNFLILFGAMAVLALVNIVVWSWGKSRNKAVNFISGLIIGFMGITAAWFVLMRGTNWFDILDISSVWNFAFNYADHNSFSVSRFGRSGVDFSGGMLVFIYFIEFLAFLAPAFITIFKTLVFCEKCNSNTASIEYYAPYNKDQEAELKSVKDGMYNHILSKMNFSGGFSGAEGTTLFKVEDQICPKCKDFRVLKIEEGFVKKDEKGNKEFKKKSVLVDNIEAEMPDSVTQLS